MEIKKHLSALKERPKFSFLILGIFCVIFALAGGYFVYRSSASPVWNLVWADEFNDTSVDTTKWGVQDPGPDSAYNMYGYLNYGDAAYNAKNVTESNGSLQLTTDKTSYLGKSYSTGGVSTYKKYTFLYGKVDIRAQLPKMSNGVWPAFWFVAEDSGRNCVYEVDLMEAVDKPNTLYFNYHDNKHGGNPNSSYTGTDFSAGMHDYEMEWTSSHLILRVDGVDRLTITEGVPDMPMYLMINTALGGSWPNPPDSTTVLPTVMNVDYVRIYKEGTSTTASVDTTAPVVAFSSPANGATISGAYNITASASDNTAVAKVEYYLDGALKATSTTSPYAYSWDTKTAVNGAHVLKASAYDSAGNMASASISVTVNNVTTPTDALAPTVSITTPANNATVARTTNVAANATDNVAVSKLEFYVDSALKATDTASPYSFTWVTTVADNGKHAIKAKAYDAAGNSSENTTSVSVNNSTAVKITQAPASGSTRVSTNVAVNLVSDSPLDPATVTSANVGLRKYSNGATIPATVSYNSVTKTITIKPKNSLSRNTQYYVYISSRVKNSYGTSLTQWDSLNKSSHYFKTVKKWYQF